MEPQVHTTFALSIVALLLCVFIHWFFFDDNDAQEPDHNAIQGYRSWKSQANTWADLEECNDMIDEEMAKAHRKKKTPFQKMCEWWRGEKE
jgi:hypothetical protein